MTRWPTSQVSWERVPWKCSWNESKEALSAKSSLTSHSLCKASRPVQRLQANPVAGWPARVWGRASGRGWDQAVRPVSEPGLGGPVEWKARSEVKVARTEEKKISPHPTLEAVPAVVKLRLALVLLEDVEATAITINTGLREVTEPPAIRVDRRSHRTNLPNSPQA